MSVISSEMVKAIGAAVGPGRSFVILVKEDGAPTADIAGSARNPEDVRQIRICVEALTAGGVLGKPNPGGRN